MDKFNLYKQMISIFSLFLLVSSCCCDNNDKEEDLFIIGKWSLTKYEQGFSPVENFQEGKIIWDFKQNGNVTVSIDTSVTTTLIKPNGNYSYSLNVNKILIDNVNFEYDYEIESKQLLIFDNASSDGFRAEFSRME